MRALFDKYPFVARVMAIDLILLCFFLDQISKWLILERVIRPHLHSGTGIDFLHWMLPVSMERLGFVSVPIFPFFNMTLVWNEGVSFGLFANHSASGNGLLAATLLLIVVIFSIWMVKTSDPLIRFMLALIIGGALGNLWDRVRFGAVIDFLDFHAYGWHYPAFNIADSCIVIGILILMVYELFWHERPHPSQES